MLSERVQTGVPSRDGSPRRPYTGPNYSLQNRLARVVWSVAYVFLFRFSPRPLHGWRRLMLRCFGAVVGAGSRVYPRARVWAPWNLRLGQVVGVADDVEIYNPELVKIGDFAVISQGAYLCGASHDYRLWQFPLIAQPIAIGRHAWVAARAIVQMGVSVGEGCVIGAGSVVTRDTPPWTVCAGNPCRVIRQYEKSED